MNKRGKALVPKERPPFFTLLKEEIRNQEGYETLNPTYPVRLDANESAYPLPLELRQELLEELKKVEIHRYPEAGARALGGKFAETLGVARGMLMMGNGSDELIQILCLATAPTTVVIPSPTFAMYRIIATNCGHRVLEVPLDGDLDLDVEQILRQSFDKQCRITFLSYPNNPTGNCFRQERMEALIRNFPGFVVVDEAYGNYSDRTFLPLIYECENLIILRSLSKIGFAGLRIGFMIAQEELVKELEKVRLPYNVNAFSQKAAALYLKHEDFFRLQAEKIKKEREKLFFALKEIRGIHPYPSQANFIFFRCDFSSDLIYDALKTEGILIRNFPKAGNFQNCLRVTVGKPEENALFIESLKRNIEKLGA